MLGGIIDPHYYGEIGLFLPFGGKKKKKIMSGDPLGNLMVLLHPVM